MTTMSAVSAMTAARATRSHSSSTEVRRLHSKPNASTLSVSGSAATMLAVDANVVVLTTSVGNESPAAIAAHVTATAAGTTSSTARQMFGAAWTSAPGGDCRVSSAYPHAATGTVACHTT